METNFSFSGTIPDSYHKNLGPLLFEVYAIDLIERIQIGDFKSVLELACGTGIVTKYLPEIFTHGETLVATDINPDMMEIAKKKITGERIEWNVVDMMNIPYPDNSFDLIFSQFGLMFVPDKDQVYSEAYRVLKPGGKFLFNVWNTLEKNELFVLTKKTVNNFFPDNPITFYDIPFSYNDKNEIEKSFAKAGFKDVSIDELPKTCVTSNPEDAATGLTTGNPAAAMINERNAAILPEIYEKLRDAMEKNFGRDPMKCKLNALVCEGIK